MAMTFPGEFRPGGPTSPQLAEWHLKFLQAEADETATLMGFFKQARLELEAFIREGDLSMSDARFFRDLLDETNRIGTKLNDQGATWVSNVIPEAYSAGRRLTSSVVIPENALRALSRDPLSLISQTSDYMRTRVRQVVATGILEGLSGADLRQRIIATGLENIPRWPSIEYRAGVIARTETMRAFNNGNIDGLVDNGARFVRWIASPDEATCPICLPRDGHVFSIDADSGGEPYPDASPLSVVGRPPVHPRCRCTVRAEYRDPAGQVIRQGALNPQPPEDPKLPADAMGADKEPEVPVSVGDFKKALGRLTDPELRRAFDEENMGVVNPALNADDPIRVQIRDAARERMKVERAFWRSVTMDEQKLRMLADMKGVKGFEAFDSYLYLRNGARFFGKTWPADGKFYALKALERIRAMNPEYLVDSPFFKRLGEHRGGFGGRNVIAAAWPTGDVDVVMAKWKRYLAGDALRAGPGVNGGEEVILHEFAHILHYEFGLHEGSISSRGMFKAIRNLPGETWRDFEHLWKSITTRKEIAPNGSALTQLDAEIERYKKLVDDPARSWLKQYNEDALRRLVEKREELRRALASGSTTAEDYYPTEYAWRGGYPEDFAESVMLYHLNPKLLKSWSPGRYEFIRKWIANEREF